jgi:hypothetical protein
MRINPSMTPVTANTPVSGIDATHRSAPAHEPVATTTTSADGVTVDMPWKADADAAIAAVEEKRGPMSDAMKNRVYGDFAGRAAGLSPTAPKSAPIWKELQAANAPVAEPVTSPVEETTDTIAASDTDASGDTNSVVDASAGDTTSALLDSIGDAATTSSDAAANSGSDTTTVTG